MWRPCNRSGCLRTWPGYNQSSIRGFPAAERDTVSRGAQIYKNLYSSVLNIQEMYDSPIMELVYGSEPPIRPINLRIREKSGQMSLNRGDTRVAL